MKPRVPVVVFSALDGTLFDPYCRPLGEVSRAVDFFERAGVPLVFFSSRTRAELEAIQEELGISAPFVSENGGSLFYQRDYFDIDLPPTRMVAGYHAIGFGIAYSEVVRALKRSADQVGVRLVCFSDQSIQQVASEAGLSLLRARLAKLREYTEPFRLQGHDPAGLKRLTKALRGSGLRCVPAGSHFHALADVDPAAIVDLLITWYRRAFGSVLTIGLGVTADDVPFLKRVDLPLILNIDNGASGTGAISVPGASLIKTAQAETRPEVVRWVEELLRDRLSVRHPAQKPH